MIYMFMIMWLQFWELWTLFTPSLWETTPCSQYSCFYWSFLARSIYLHAVFNSFYYWHNLSDLFAWMKELVCVIQGLTGWMGVWAQDMFDPKHLDKIHRSVEYYANKCVAHPECRWWSLHFSCFRASKCVVHTIDQWWKKYSEIS